MDEDMRMAVGQGGRPADDGALRRKALEMLTERRADWGADAAALVEALCDRLGRLEGDGRERGAPAGSERDSCLHLELDCEASYRSLFANTHAMLFLINPTTLAIVEASPAACEFYGYPHDELMRRRITDFNLLSPEDVLRDMARAASGERNRFEFQLRVAGGDIRDVEVHSGPVRIHNREYLFSILHDITDRKRIEERLRESEGRLQILFEYAPDAYYLCDGEGRYIDGNRAAEEMIGFAKEALLGKTFFEAGLLPPEELALGFAVHQKNVRGFASGPDEFHLIRNDGRQVPVEIRTYPVKIQGKTVILGIARDIAPRKRTESALREIQHFLETAQEVAHIGSWISKPGQAGELKWSREVYRIFGVSEESFDGKVETFYSLVHPDDRERVRQAAIRAGFDRDEPYDVVHRIVRPDGTIRWVHERAEVKRDGHGQPVETVGVVQDVTERKQAEEQIRSLSRFPAENPSPVLRIAPDGTILYANKSSAPLRAHLALQTGERVGEEWRPRIAEALETGLNNEIEIECGERVFSLMLSPVSESQYVNVYGRDITERRRAEDERLKLEAQIQQAQKLESLGVLAGGIAHDFNNLLTGILGYADLALMDLSPVSPARATIEQIEKSARRAAELTRQLLAYSGKGRFVVQPIDLSELVREMAYLLSISISKRCILKYEFADSLPRFEADAAQIRQIVMNLIINASEAIGEKSGVVAVLTGARTCDRAYLADSYLDENRPEGLYVYLEVADTGCGMTPETLARVFDPFFTTKFTGRGLGLAAVLGIVRGHKGAIKIDSVPGRGTTFRVLFPASERTAARDDAAPAPAPAWHSNGTVLVVDDEETVRALAGAMLEKAGFTVLTAAGGRQALKVFQARGDEIRAVLLDMTMPDMDGREVFRELRRIRPGVRVVLSSGYNEQEVTEPLAGLGLAGFIQKPYRLDDLLNGMRQAIEGPAADCSDSFRP
jgi:PAS domain S-box-containing protein